VIGAFIEIAMFKISGRGTPTETDARRHLVPLCKFNMVPMLMVRVAGFVFAVVALTFAERFCSCARNNLPEELLEERNMARRDFSVCPTSTREWYVCARLVIFTMACDALFPAITLIVVLRQRIHRWYRRIRPPRERGLEDVQRSWQLKCKRCCECSSLMTCYMCGGQKLTAGSYADVAIALTDFFSDDGLDIVPSDIAAAMICLVNIQKQKQIDCKNELVREGGIFAKDRRLATRLWRQFNHSNNTRSPISRRSGSMRDVSNSLKNSLSMTAESLKNSGDIEEGLDTYQDDESHPIENESLGQNRISRNEEEKEEIIAEKETQSTSTSSKSTSTSSIQPTDTELEQLRQMILTRRDTMQKINFRLIHKDSRMLFEPTVSRVLSPSEPFDCLVLGEGSRYCAVALASYSWMMYMWTNKCTGACRLTANSIFHPRCFCCHSNDNIVGDNICGWKEATVLKSLDFEESDILYANFRNDVSVNPYLILRDEKWKTIVLTIRGTLSFEDMISDVTISPKSLEEIGKQFGFDGRGEYCHSGMLAGAKWIYDDLKRHKILDKAMEANPDFGLRIIGHSLGAGVAAMLGRVLRKQFPNLYCLCFSPPGCVFSERTAKESKDYVCSYVLHNDIVPRLSYASLCNLRTDLIEMIARIKVPKHKVFYADLKSWNEKSLLSLPEKLLHGKEDIPKSQFSTEFENFKARQSQRQEERDTAHIKMTVPGRILHMVRTSTKLNNVPCGCLLSCAQCIAPCQETKKYKVRWTEAEDLSEIYISPTMMVDHFPYNVAHALEIAAESYGVADQATDLHKRDQLVGILEGVKKDR